MSIYDIVILSIYDIFRQKSIGVYIFSKFYTFHEKQQFLASKTPPRHINAVRRGYFNQPKGK